ncbi:MAG: beta-N-acetylhexosaminidase [Acidimicrobiales bacterium]|nr:beta-N-acetylhexosaminidase [Hyphomonadaceae bacterium]RZV41813.1 MAG: beta-N-acetylhexosaminidase [Acidimicrobiales bacterium]
MSEAAAIFGCQGPSLSPGESAFFRDCNPWAFILFSRNIETPDQVRKLCADLRSSVGRNALIFVDQEGGRVQRLKPPHWRKMPSARIFGDLYRESEGAALRATWLNYRLIADELRSVGISANCAPVLDLPVDGADPIISDRAFSQGSEITTITLANACMSGLMAGGVLPVIKHIPGHGRATVDSHKELPVIYEPLDKLNATDFGPFKAFNDAPAAMTAHVVLKRVDPDNPVTMSKTAMASVVRENIGYQGLVMTDDLDMKALKGDLTYLTQASLKAGCDVVLQCSGKLPAMVKVAKGLGKLRGKSLERARISENVCDYVESFDAHAGYAEYQDIMKTSDRFAETFV